MLVHGAELAEGAVLRARAAVVGAGPAGLALAHELGDCLLVDVFIDVLLLVLSEVLLTATNRVAKDIPQLTEHVGLVVKDNPVHAERPCRRDVVEFVVDEDSEVRVELRL